MKYWTTLRQKRVSIYEHLRSIFEIISGEKTSSKVECYYSQKEKWTVLGDLNVGRSAVSACAVGDLGNAHEYTFYGNDGGTLTYF